MEGLKGSEPPFGNPLLLRMLRVPAPVCLVDLAFALVLQELLQRSSKSVAAVREAASLDELVQPSRVLLRQTHWYLNCHTLKYTRVRIVRNPAEADMSLSAARAADLLPAVSTYPPNLHACETPSCQ